MCEGYNSVLSTPIEADNIVLANIGKTNISVDL